MLLESSGFQRTIVTLIVVNAVLLGLETWPAAMAAAGGLIASLDRAILVVFVFEIGARLWVHRSAFWRDPWSVFDFLVVAIALVPASGPFAVLRALRVLRVLRLLSTVPSMRRVVGALVLLIFFYVFAVIATNLFAADYPDWFGSIGKSLYTLFQIMTLESWSMGIVRPVMETHPWAWAFFVPFILVATFTMLNLFIAIIVDATQRYAHAEHEHIEEQVEKVGEELERHLHDDLRALRGEIAELRSALRERAAGGVG